MADFFGTWRLVTLWNCILWSSICSNVGRHYPRKFFTVGPTCIFLLEHGSRITLAEKRCSLQEPPRSCNCKSNTILLTNPAQNRNSTCASLTRTKALRLFAASLSLRYRVARVMAISTRHSVRQMSVLILLQSSPSFKTFSR